MSKESKPEKSSTKTKKKETTTMKKPIIYTVIITLAVVASFAATFIAGMNYEHSNSERIKSEVKSLTAVVKESK